MFSSVKRIAVTGGAGQIAYSLLFRLASGELLGKEQPIALHILDLPQMEQALRGVAMELEDCAFPLLREVVVGSDPEELFAGAHYAFLVGAKPRGPGMERKDLLADNGQIFVAQGKALDRVAERSLLTLVVGNPCNTNALLAASAARHLSPRQFFAMTRLDQNRAAALLARRSGRAVREVSQMAVWGNHSSTQVPDFIHARIGKRSAEEVIGDRRWLEKEFIPLVQNRGAAVIAECGRSSAASAASAALDTMRSLLFPTPEGEWFSCAVASAGNPYGIKEGIFFSFPCRSKGEGRVEIASGIEIDPFLRDLLAISERELVEEREVIASLM